MTGIRECEQEEIWANRNLDMIASDLGLRSGISQKWKDIARAKGGSVADRQMMKEWWAVNGEWVG